MRRRAIAPPSRDRPPIVARMRLFSPAQSIPNNLHVILFYSPVSPLYESERRCCAKEKRSQTMENRRLFASFDGFFCRETKQNTTITRQRVACLLFLSQQTCAGDLVGNLKKLIQKMTCWKKNRAIKNGHVLRVLIYPSSKPRNEKISRSLWQCAVRAWDLSRPWRLAVFGRPQFFKPSSSPTNPPFFVHHNRTRDKEPIEETTVSRNAHHIFFSIDQKQTVDHKKNRIEKVVVWILHLKTLRYRL